MKQLLIIFAVAVAVIVYSETNARTVKALQSPVTGRVIDVEGNPVAYATVIAVQNGTQAAGTTTGEDGAFALTLDSGDYTFSIEFLGYTSVERRLTVSGATDIGTVTLEYSDIEIQSVEVTAQVIRREADRFVVDVANMPSAIGKDGVELLQTSPGVFIDDDKITINGKSGTKVYVNDREIRYTGDRLLSYLRGLKNDEIKTIEVVPIAGADQDADSAGGIIKITLKRKRDDGLMGGLSLNGSVNDFMLSFAPSAYLDYRTGRWTLSASGAYGYYGNRFESTEKTVYTDNDNILTSKSEGDGIDSWYYACAGAVFEINDRNSLGAEVEYSGNGSNSKNGTTTSSRLEIAEPNIIDLSEGRYSPRSKGSSITARFNYIAKLDTLGSTFKLLADYTHQQSSSGNDYITSKQTIIGDLVSLRDSIYRDNAGTDYDITTVSASFDKIFSSKFTLKTGAKYTNNLMSSFSTYDYLAGEAWQTRPAYNYDVDYTENIAAAYVIGDAKLGRWGLNFGLRGEYTHTSGRRNVVRQNYFSLFPNASLSFGLKKDQSYMLAAQYSRNITRPNFWALNPARHQISEYLYQTGNPDLEPAYTHNLSLSLVMKYKYTLTFGAQLHRNEIQQLAAIDDENPNIGYIITENLDSTQLYYASLNLPFQFTKWWSANANLTGMYSGTRISRGLPQTFHPMFMGNASMTFTLPLQFYISVDWWGMSRAWVSNVMIHSRNNLNLSVKKRLFKDRLSLSVGVRNLLAIKNEISYSDERFRRVIRSNGAWTRQQFTFSVSYNFNAGKHFNKRAIESDADSSRLGK